MQFAQSGGATILGRAPLSDSEEKAKMHIGSPDKPCGLSI